MDEADVAAQLALEGMYDDEPPAMEELAKMMRDPAAAAAALAAGAPPGAGGPLLPGAAPGALVGASAPAATAVAGPGGPGGPGGAPAFDMAAIKKWTVVYPCYINPRKRACEGRRLPVSKCTGCDDPHPVDIFHALMAVGFNPRQFVGEQNKVHPRDPWSFGRVRVQLESEDGKPTLEGVATKTQLLEAVAAKLPHTDFRKMRLAQLAASRQAMEAKRAAMEKGAGKGKAGGAGAGAAAGGAAAGGAAAKGKKSGKR